MNSVASAKLPKVYLVIFRYGNSEPWEVHNAARGKLDAVAHVSKKEAEHEARQLRPYHSRKNVKVIRYEARIP